MSRRLQSAPDPGLADLLEPQTPRAPASPIQDFAFADTVHARDLAELTDELVPPSGPVIVNAPNGSQAMTPRTFPLPAAAISAPHETRLRHAVRRSVRELAHLWFHTKEAVDEAEPASRTAVTVRRVRALWSSWEWERADVLRATVIGLAVFVAAATLGAFALGPRASRASRDVRDGAPVEVREARTLDQGAGHTGHTVPVRARSTR